MASISTCAPPFPFNIAVPHNGRITLSKWPLSLLFFPPLPITLMRIRCHSSSCGCLLFNWRLIFRGCHFKRENKGLPFIVAPVKGGGDGVWVEGGEVVVTQSDGSVMCFGLQTLLSRLSVSLALHILPYTGGLRFHLATPSISEKRCPLKPSTYKPTGFPGHPKV